MSSDTDNQRKTERSLERQHWSCAAALALAAASVGCALDGVRPMASLSAGSLSASRIDRGTCEGLYVQSIWKGEDLSGPECASYAAPGGNTAGAQELEYDRRRVQKVCEQTQLRTILSGEASSKFTLQACAPHEPGYQQARLGKACKEVSRARSRQQEELTPAQSAACKTYLAPSSSGAAVAVAAAQPRWGGAVLPRGGGVGLPRGGFATVPERASDAAAPHLAVQAAAASEERADPPTCEDRYVESIWKGEDVTGGAQCAGQVAADGSTPNYRLARIQNVCEGAEARAVRSGAALPAFTAQACQSVFAARAPSVAAVAPAVAPAVAVDASAAAPPPSAPGLDERTIAATVDAHWRSIGRDCMAVAPRSSAEPAAEGAATASAEPAHTPVSVTIHVAASGEVRQVSARVRGHDALELCIERSVRGWVFPAAERDTEIGLPLVFVGE